MRGTGEAGRAPSVLQTDARTAIPADLEVQSADSDEAQVPCEKQLTIRLAFETINRCRWVAQPLKAILLC
jgi:hypothetical protein